MKKFTITFLLLVVITGIAFGWLQLTSSGKKFSSLYVTKVEKETTPLNTTLIKLHSKAVIAKSFVRDRDFNDNYCFLLDMSLPSGQNRFFVYDLQKDTISSSGLVTHGRCNEDWLKGRKYNNTVGGGCTSLGKYKIGYSYKGRFGLAFKLYGLDKTNDNAFKRYVVLHAHECVPANEIEGEICQSDGCPTVSPEYLEHLEKLIKKSSKPVLLWIF